MKITAELLERCEAYPEDTELIDNLFPNGVEYKDLIANKEGFDIEPELLHFIARYLPCSKEEMELYENFFNIKNSKHFYYSENLEGSLAIAKSRDILNSEYVRHSSRVSLSKWVYDSYDIEESQNILSSSKIKHSNRVVGGKEVSHSSQINRSNYVDWSNNILASSTIEECNYIYHSFKVSDCHFSGFLRGCKNCIFCSNLEDKQFHVFNEEVSPVEFVRLKEELQFRLAAETPDYVRVDSAALLPLNRFKTSARPDRIFDGLSPELYGWIGTVQNFREDLFLQIFLSKSNLKFVEAGFQLF